MFLSSRGSLCRVSSTNVVPLPFAAPLAALGRAQHPGPEPSAPSLGLPPQRTSPLQPPVPAPARSHLASCRPGRVFGNLCQQGTSASREPPANDPINVDIRPCKYLQRKLRAGRRASRRCASGHQTPRAPGSLPACCRHQRCSWSQCPGVHQEQSRMLASMGRCLLKEDI